VWLLSQLNPAVNLTYEVLADVFYDLSHTFPDTQIHLGYDEINHNCWEMEPSIVAYMAQNNLTIGELLREFFVRQREVLAQVAPSRTFVYWEEAAMQDPPLPLQPTGIAARARVPTLARIFFARCFKRATPQPPSSQRCPDVIQVWSDKDALQAALVNTSCDVLVSWSSNVYLDCGLGNMFGDDSW
jgi:hexosaminidase